MQILTLDAVLVSFTILVQLLSKVKEQSRHIYLLRARCVGRACRQTGSPPESPAGETFRTSPSLPPSSLRPDPAALRWSKGSQSRRSEDRRLSSPPPRTSRGNTHRFARETVRSVRSCPPTPCPPAELTLYPRTVRTLESLSTDNFLKMFLLWGEFNFILTFD